MIIYRSWSIFDAVADALVCPVNCVGVMGKGLALAFARRWPAMVEPYRAACHSTDLRIGRCWVWDTSELPWRLVVCFPTKEHWRHPSRIEYVERGLDSLRAVIDGEGLESIAVPALGCGAGGLRWPDVKPMIASGLAGVAANVVVCEPTPEPSPALGRAACRVRR